MPTEPATITPPRTWHTLEVATVAAALGTDPERGLAAHEAARRLREVGPNEIEEGHRRSALALLLGQFTDFMIVVLLAAAVVSGLIGDMVDTLAIVTIVVLNAVIGFVQEYRAERAMAALKQLAALTAHVLRDGTSALVPATGLVPGDVVLLEAGQAVPADLRLIETARLRVDEAALTGESQPAEKVTAALADPDLAIGDRRDMAFKGTLVTYGRGRGLVVATGMRTEIGGIAALLRGAEEGQTPLQRRLAAFGRSLALAVLAICAVLFAGGILRGEPVMLMLLTAISLAVAAIPEALPAVVSVSLALGARKMSARNALVRKLPAVETLGSVTFICSDKTGTLTENRMQVDQLWAGGATEGALAPATAAAEPWRSLLVALALSNDARTTADGEIVGDPTEVALHQVAHRAGMDKGALEATAARVAEIPFEAERACMTTLHRATDGVTAYTKGAPEQVLGRCTDALGSGGIGPVDRAAAERVAERMAADGLRVLAVAMRRWPALPSSLDPEAVETGLTLLGLVGLLDPPRPAAAQAVHLCRSAGITPVMITGDHPATASAIARRLDILDDHGEVLTGAELDRLDAGELAAHVERVRVYARVAPQQKIRIVQALQEAGEFVAMTGDGVNDAPALRRADIGVAMGVTGTDVAKEAGHMILLDDDFATIVSAVREGRRIFDNIRKFIKYTMTSNSGEIWTIFLAPFLGLPIPLLPIHILWINLVTDGLPGLALTAEPEERGIMRRPPRPPNERIFAHGMWQHILWVGLLMGATSLLTQALAIAGEHVRWQTMVFTVLTLSQLGHVLAIHRESDSSLAPGAWANRPLLAAVGLTTLLQLATIYVPWLNPIFRTTPLSLPELGFCLAMSAVVFVAVEIEKWAMRRGWLYPGSASA